MAGAYARVGERKGAYRIFVGKSAGKNDWEDGGLDGRIILQLIFKR